MQNNLLYEKYKYKIREGDVITFEGQGFISKCILKFTERSHVASVVGQVDTNNIKRRLIIEADQGEVNARLLSEKLRQYKGRAYWHPLKANLEEYRDDLSSFLWAHVGIGYDFWGLFINAIKRPGTNPKSFYCSELTGASFYYPPKIKGFKAPCAIPESLIDLFLMTKDYKENKYLQMLVNGKGLRPGGVAKLPFFKKEIRIL